MSHTFKEIPIDQWDRKSHHEFFIKNFHFPHVSITANVNITSLLKTCNKKDLSIFHSTVYLISKALNGIPQFRQRIRKESLIEWARVGVSYTVLTQDEKFYFCYVDYNEDFSLFYKQSVEKSERIKRGELLDLNPTQEDNVLYMSCIPWVSFTGMSNAQHSNLYDSVPRIAWGKFFNDHHSTLMPFNIQAHHSVVDGLHIGRAFEAFQEQLNNFKP